MLKLLMTESPMQALLITPCCPFPAYQLCELSLSLIHLIACTFRICCMRPAWVLSWAFGDLAAEREIIVARAGVPWMICSLPHASKTACAESSSHHRQHKILSKTYRDALRAVVWIGCTSLGISGTSQANSPYPCRRIEHHAFMLALRACPFTGNVKFCRSQKACSCCT